MICQFVWQAGSCSCQRSYGVISTRLQPVLDSNLYSVQSIQSRVVIRTLTDYGIQSIVPRSRHILLLYVYVLHINCMFGGGPIFHMMLYSIGRSSENKQQTTNNGTAVGRRPLYRIEYSSSPTLEYRAQRTDSVQYSVRNEMNYRASARLNTFLSKLKSESLELGALFP